MTKSIRKIRPLRKPLKPPQETVKPGFRIPASKLVFVVIVILAGIPFILGRYFELNYPDPFDSGGYAYSARHVLDGARIGIDEIPSAKLGTLLVNMLGVWLWGFSETGPKLIQAALQAMALVLMFAAMRKAFGAIAAAVGVIITSIYISAPVIAKFGNVKEQYVIAFAVLAVSCLVLRQLDGPWWWALLAGAFVSWVPLFKETGLSAIGAMGLFVVLQPLLKNRTWKQTGVDILLLLAGAIAAIGPLYIWIIGWDLKIGLPYSFVWWILAKAIPAKNAASAAGAAAAPAPDYVSGAWTILKPDEKKEVIFRIFRYYGVLILPVSLAVGSIAARIVRLVGGWLKKPKGIEGKSYDRFVLLFGLWWLLDMAFVWVSPRSYEQYYLPLNASAAMLGGYLTAIYSDWLKSAVHKARPAIIGIVGLLAMIIMSWHIFFGIKTSPYSGTTYRDQDTGNPIRQRGYAQKLEEISQRRKGKVTYPWEEVGEYIRTHSQPTDKIYVWGWIPGIYVRAQRFSSSPTACTSEMHVNPPAVLSTMVGELLSAFKRQPPKFIVDTYNKHFPYDRRPPLELWPRIANGLRLLDNLPKERERLMRVLLQTYNIQLDELDKNGFLRPDKQSAIERYEAAYAKELREKIEPDEALRYEAMKPMREFVMKNYKIAQLFGEHVLFELKNPTPNKELQ
jgi:hypothetical protein